MHTPALLRRPLAWAAAFATTLFAHPPPPPGPHTLWYRTAGEASADRLELDLVIQPNTSASVHVPAADPRQVKESGKAASRAKGVRLLRHDSGHAVFTVGSGTYRFTAPLPLPEVAP
jgi:hypothetical protein